MTNGRRHSGKHSVITNMFTNVSIIGDGAMGTVLAMLLCGKSIPVRMWGHDAEQLKQIERDRENRKFLPGYKLAPGIMFEPDETRITHDADLIVSAVPCQYIRPVFRRLKDYVPAGLCIVSVAKGIENNTLLRPTQIIADVLGDGKKPKRAYAALSGPTIADELARKLPATATAACLDQHLAAKVQYTFSARWLRVYTNTDIIGVELAGAMKNIIAINTTGRCMRCEGWHIRRVSRAWRPGNNLHFAQRQKPLFRRKARQSSDGPAGSAGHRIGY